MFDKYICAVTGLPCCGCSFYCEHRKGKNEEIDMEQTKPCECKYHGLEKCECEYHGLEKGDALYVYESWDGGIEFNAIKNIKYCPICGKELPEER